MMWNEKEAVNETIVDIIRFLDNFHGYEEELEDELRAYIQQKYGVYSETEVEYSEDTHLPIKWKRNIVVEEKLR